MSGINVGSILMDIDVDNSGFLDGVNEIQRLAENALTAIGRSISESFSGDAISEFAGQCGGLAEASMLSEGDLLPEGLLSRFEAVSGGFSEMLAGMGANWDEAWKWMGESFAATANTVIDGLNILVDGLNAIKIDIPEWVPEIGGNSFQMSIPKLAPVPQLARGGIVTQPTLAMVGERGREAVIPLENSEWMSELANRIGMVIAGNSAVRQAAVVELAIDGRKFAEATIEDIQSVSARKGISVF